MAFRTNKVGHLTFRTGRAGFTPATWPATLWTIPTSTAARAAYARTTAPERCSTAQLRGTGTRGKISVYCCPFARTADPYSFSGLLNNPWLNSRSYDPHILRTSLIFLFEFSSLSLHTDLPSMDMFSMHIFRNILSMRRFRRQSGFL